MRILHVIPSVATVRGGPSQAVVEMVQAQRNLGIHAEIVATNDNGNDLLDLPVCTWLEYKQVPVQLFPRFSPNIDPIREFAFSRQLTAWLWQNVANYDLLHIHAIFSYASTAAMAIARLQGIPYIIRPLGQLCEWSLRQSARKKQLYLSLIERANLNCGRAVHLTSKQEQQEVSRLNLKAPSFVLPHGLTIPPVIPDARDRLRKHLNISANEPVILFLSRLHPKKGLDYLIPALGKLDHYRFTFAIAGNGSKEYEAEVEKLLVANGIRDRAHLIGFVEGEIKNIFMQGADLFALTSHSENFAVVVLESLAAGIPVLTTPGVALANLIQKYQLGYVAELDVSAIASAIERYLTYPQEAKNMGDRARQMVAEKYAWERMAEKMQRIYTNILQGDPISSSLDQSL
jgi:glycosyltransferase involved in cell wall biosynthesis